MKVLEKTCFGKGRKLVYQPKLQKIQEAQTPPAKRKEKCYI